MSSVLPGSGAMPNLARVVRPQAPDSVGGQRLSQSARLRFCHTPKLPFAISIANTMAAVTVMTPTMHATPISNGGINDRFL